MQAVLTLMLEGLEPEERDAVARRVEAMVSELAYLKQTKPEQLREAGKHGWTRSKLEVAFCLNSFYQRILAPLWASAASPAIIGGEIPIRYGNSFLFNSERNADISKMSLAFLDLCKRYQIRRPMLEAQRTGDLIWNINHPSENADAEEKAT